MLLLRPWRPAWASVEVVVVPLGVVTDLSIDMAACMHVEGQVNFCQIYKGSVVRLLISFHWIPAVVDHLNNVVLVIWKLLEYLLSLFFKVSLNTGIIHTPPFYTNEEKEQVYIYYLDVFLFFDPKKNRKNPKRHPKLEIFPVRLFVVNTHLLIHLGLWPKSKVINIVYFATRINQPYHQGKFCYWLP